MKMLVAALAVLVTAGTAYTAYEQPTTSPTMPDTVCDNESVWNSLVQGIGARTCFDENYEQLADFNNDCSIDLRDVSYYAQLCVEEQ